MQRGLLDLRGLNSNRTVAEWKLNARSFMDLMSTNSNRTVAEWKFDHCKIHVCLLHRPFKSNRCGMEILSTAALIRASAFKSNRCGMEMDNRLIGIDAEAYSNRTVAEWKWVLGVVAGAPRDSNRTVAEWKYRFSRIVAFSLIQIEPLRNGNLFPSSSVYSSFEFKSNRCGMEITCRSSHKIPGIIQIEPLRNGNQPRALCFASSPRIQIEPLRNGNQVRRKRLRGPVYSNRTV